MADKTSWTKPPSVHRYGDSRLVGPGAEAALGRRVLAPPEGGGERAAGRGRVSAAREGHARPPPASQQTGSAGSQRGIGRTRVGRGRSAHEVSTSRTRRGARALRRGSR